VISMLPRLLLVLLATTWAVDPRPILGAVVHARGPVHAMNRTELQAELDERGARRLESDSDDELRMRLYHARTELLEQRTKVVMQAEAIMQEVHQHGDERFLASWSLDSVLSDDNAIFMNAMGLRMLESLKFQAIVGACVGVVLAWLAPLGRLPRRMLLPNFAASPTLQTVAVVAGGGATFGALQLLLKFVRRLLGAQSLFCQKLAAVTCRDAAIEWMLEKEKRPTFAGGATSASASASAAVADLPLVPLWRRRGVIVPVIILATGSSIFEEVVFRGILLHGLVSKARWPAALATTLTSLAFGLMHIRNEASLLHSSVYAGWTFVGGLVFSAAYLGTRGGLVAPILLHFGLNAIIFGDSALRVGAKLDAEREGSRQVVRRATATQQQRQQQEQQEQQERDAVQLAQRMQQQSVGATPEGGDGMAGVAAAGSAGSLRGGGVLRQRGLTPLRSPSGTGGELFLLA